MKLSSWLRAGPSTSDYRTVPLFGKSVPAKPGLLLRSITRALKQIVGKWPFNKSIVSVPPARVAEPARANSRPQRVESPPAGRSVSSIGQRPSFQAGRGAASPSSTFQRVAMPADPKRPALLGFPHAINYDFGPVRPVSGPMGCSTLPTEALSKAVRSRQGVVEWVVEPPGGAGKPSLVNELLARLNEGDVHVGGVTFHALEQGVCTGGLARFTALVSAPSDDQPGVVDTFRVPVTQCNANEALSKGDSATAMLAGGVIGDHMTRVDWAYRDSVDTPLVIDQAGRGLGELSVLATEVTSQSAAGMLRNRVDVQRAVDQAAQRMPTLQAQQWDITAVTDGAEGLRSGLQQNLRWLGAEVLAAKRHVPIEASAVGSPPPELVRNPVTLTLKGLAPMTRLPTERAAYRQPQQDNHCGVVAINAFFQTEAVTSVKVINQMLEQWGGVFSGAAGLESLGLPGLMSPAIVRAMREGRSVEIDRNQFVGRQPSVIPDGYEALYMGTPEQQWRTLENYLYDLHGARPGQDRIRVTPDLWLSAMLGLHLDQATAIINGLLRTKGNDPAWQDYPDSVVSIALHAPQSLLNLEQRIDQVIEARRASGQGGHFPIVCMVTGHYFTLARTARGDWLKLGSDGTRQHGLQEAAVFARRGELADRLAGIGAIHLVCEALPAATHELSIFRRTERMQPGAIAAQAFLDYTQGAPLTGLHSPQVLNAIAKGETVTLSRSEVTRKLSDAAQNNWGFLVEGRAAPEQQWRAAVNLCEPRAKGLNWVDHAATLGRIDSIQVTPAQWAELHENLGFGKAAKQ